MCRIDIYTNAKGNNMATNANGLKDSMVNKYNEMSANFDPDNVEGIGTKLPSFLLVSDSSLDTRDFFSI